MRSSRRSVVLCCSSLLLSIAAVLAHAESPPPAPSGDAVNAAEAEATAFTAVPGEAELDAILVSGPQPGPGLWKVRKGEHVMWILGTVGPLPKRMEWDASTVERHADNSDRVP